ncbi:neutral/alkaline non-lysosomal ceramidase N-terminal domain-containing protein [Allorhizobium borbori]|uniref:Neutral/alkaline non-lysosomal ceramidase N-terminal domain-containing protein n=1 Tax=Allorhizobium borbori TaxID=485907 RepID=A0A7W6P0Z5_9HYPH|nr:neutral/alkaline non-lysosomal ceramidase N-terminal domain-containing protein [Allorhizobium borbori]MBB4103058.1 hypothetical protein [Allorhizobium borbori]
MIDAGAAIVDITPPPGMVMAGFAARSDTARGFHDRLTARAVVIGDTAVVVADVIGIDAAMSLRIRERCALSAERVVVSALHTHGGPASMAGRLGGAADPAYLERLEDACVAAIDKAACERRPAMLSAGYGSDPDIARNRRHSGGIVDRSLPVLHLTDMQGATIAVLVSYACHPVVLGADNLLWTADYPHFTREALERAFPGSVAVFMTGCVGDANTGHSAHASISLAANPERTFAAAERIGEKIAAAALAAPARQIAGGVSVHNGAVTLGFERRETEPLPVLASRWEGEAVTADPARRSLLLYWADWARRVGPLAADGLTTRVTVFEWGGVLLVALPGEIFAETALAIRAAAGDAPVFTIAFADDNPGYIPPASEYAFGGYEVDEAHRYYGMPMSFAAGSAETLCEKATTLIREGSATNS